VKSLPQHIFISYRRADTQTITDRIYERLSNVFGKKNIFRDIDAIPIGEDFREEIKKAVNKSDVMLVVIGKKWANKANLQRLQDPEDQLRIEIEMALQSTGKLIIPLLVDDAKMPKKDKLPSSIHGLLSRNAHPIHNDPYFEFDIGKLIEFLGGRNSKQIAELQLNWRAAFFPTNDFSGTAIPVEGISRIDYNWGTGAPVVNGIPIPGIGSDNFSVRFTTKTNQLAETDYEFVIASMGRTKLTIDGVSVFDNGTLSSTPLTSQTFQQRLTSGRHEFVLEYAHFTDQALIQLFVRQT